MKSKYTKVKEEGKFTLLIKNPVYKQIETKNGYIRNKLTNENVGTKVKLYCKIYDEETFKKLDTPILEEDIYEVVKDE